MRMAVERFDTIIVGAGLSGLMAARRLVDEGLHVSIVERESVAGGRLATWQAGSDRADIGAQFFTVRTPEFQAVVEQWLAMGWVVEWSRGWSDGLSLESQPDGHPRYIAAEGFAALARELSARLPVRFSTQLDVISVDDGGWITATTEGRRIAGRSLILTPPVPQSLALLRAGGVAIPDEQRAILDDIRYGACLCGVFTVDGETTLPEPGALQRPDHSISWIADNRRKGLFASGHATLTIQVNPETSAARWGEADTEVLTWMATELEPWLAPGAQLHPITLKRWPNAIPLGLYPARYLMLEAPAPLLLAGDAFNGPRVEGAVLSGWAAADALLRSLYS